MKKAPHANNCKECGTDLRQKTWKHFCDVKCRRTFNNRRQSRGAILYDMAMTFRKRRGPDDFSNLCHQISIYLQDDQHRGHQSFNMPNSYWQWNIPKAVLMEADIVTISTKLIFNPPIKSSMSDYKYAGKAQKKHFETDDLEADRLRYGIFDIRAEHCGEDLSIPIEVKGEKP